MNRTSMQNAEPKQQAANSIYEEVANAVVEFMVDCRMSEDDVNASNLHLAFECAYRPLPRFWRDFELKTVFEAVTRQYPGWHAVVEGRQQTADHVLGEVEEILGLHGLNEANAEMMMALPLAARPQDRVAASQWIFSELRKREHNQDLRCAYCDDKHCGEGALEILDCLEQATLGIVRERLGTTVARSYRNSCLAGH